MTREELKAKGLSDEQIDFVMAENGKDINKSKASADAAQEQLKQAQEQVKGLQEQLTQRDADIKSLQETAKGNEGMSAKLSELQTKYEADTKALQKKLEDQQTDFAIEKAFADVPFASALAKRAAIADFRAKGYKVGQDGTFSEAASFIDALKKEDPAAFKTEGSDQGGKGGDDGNQGGNNGGAENGHSFANGNAWIGGGAAQGNNPGGGAQGQQQPRFTGQMSNQGQQGGAANGGMNLAFTYVRKPPETK